MAMLLLVNHPIWAKNFIPGEYIVKVKKGHEKSFLNKQFLLNEGFTYGHKIHTSFADYHLVKSLHKNHLKNELSHIALSGDIEFIEPNYIYSIPKNETITRPEKKRRGQLGDPLFEKQWGLENTGQNDPGGEEGVIGADIRALLAWNVASGSKAIKIAVIDTGVDYHHPDLKDQIWTNEKEANGQAGADDDGNGYIDDIHGYNFADDKPDPMDGHGHGTHCAGVIGATHDNGEGIRGVMKEVTIVPVKFLGDDGSGSLEKALLAIDYATHLNVDIMSNSWGGGSYSQALFDAIKHAADQGILFVAAAGNEAGNNDTVDSYPANYKLPNVISVAAMKSDNTLASFSNYGKNSVHIAAPGNDIISTIPGKDYSVMSGTSMATPHVAGALGLLLAKEGRLPFEQVKERLMFTGRPLSSLKGKIMTGSMLDASNLVNDIRPPHEGPKKENWKTYFLPEVFESTHPYKENSHVTKEFNIPGARYIRLVVTQFDLEAGYDYLRLGNHENASIEKISGTGTDYKSDAVEGSSITVDFFSDRTINKWGFKIDRIEYQE